MKMILMSGLLASAAALVTTTTDALATHGGKDNRFRNASIEWDPAGRKGPIHIFVENDGSAYTHVSGEVSTRVRLRARVWARHRLRGFMVTTYDPNVQRNHPMPHANRVAVNDGIYQISMNRLRTVTMAAADFVRVLDPGSPLFTFDGEQKLVNQCNALYQSSRPKSDAHGLEMQAHLHAGFSAGPWTGPKFVSWVHWYYAGATRTPAIASTKVPIQVVCRKFETETSDVVAPKVLDAQLAAAASGGACPQQVKLSIGVATEAPRPTKVRYRTNNGPWSTWHPLDTNPFGAAAMGVFEHNLAGFGAGTHNFQAQVQEHDGTLSASVEIACPLKLTEASLVLFQHGVVNPNSGTAMLLPARLETECPVEIGFKPNFVHQGGGQLNYRFRFLPQDVATGSYSANFAQGKNSPDLYHVLPMPLAPSGGGGGQGGIGGFQAQPNTQPQFGLKQDDGGAGPNEHKGSVRVEAETEFGLVASNWVPYHIVCEPKSVMEPVGGMTAPQRDSEPRQPERVVVTPPPPPPPSPVIVTPAPDPQPPRRQAPARLADEPVRMLQGLFPRAQENRRPQMPAGTRQIPGRSSN